MAARKRKILLTNEWKSRISVASMMRRLLDHFEGKVELTRTQISAAKIVLAKLVPDLSKSELTGADGEPLFGQPGREELIDRAIARMINNGVPADQTLGAVRALIGEYKPAEQDGNETLGNIH